MARLMVCCPTTNMPVATGVETDAAALTAFPECTSLMHCPACGKSHAWHTREAWLEDSAAAIPNPTGVRDNTEESGTSPH